MAMSCQCTEYPKDSDGNIVLSPCGLHSNWLQEQIVKHDQKKLAMPSLDDTRTGCEEIICWCHIDPKPIGYFCSHCGCRVIANEES